MQRNSQPTAARERHDPRAEAAVLGAVLLENERFEEVTDLTAADFYVERHRVIWAAMAELHEAEEPIDTVTMFEHLGRSGSLKAAGGGSYLSELSTKTPAATSISHYAERVREHRHCRDVAGRILEGVDSLSRGAESKATVRALVEELAALTKRAAVHRMPPTLADILPETLDLLARRRDGEERAIQSPWPSLTDALGGGLLPGLHVLVANTGVGKTMFALQYALHASARSVPAFVVALELDKREVTTRLAGLQSGRSWAGIWRGKEDVEPACIQELERLPFHVVEGTPHGWAYTGVRDIAEAARRQYPTGPCLIAVDFLQVVGSPPERREDARQRVQAATYAIRAAARDFGVAVLVLSSAGRQHYSALAGVAEGPKGKPSQVWDNRPEHLVGLGKESGEIEYSADTVFVLCQEAERSPASRLIHLAIAKQRTGLPTWLDLAFDGSAFHEPAKREAGDHPPTPKLSSARFSA